MDLLSALVEAGSLPSELLHQMLAVTDSAPTVKEQQLDQRCRELETELATLKQHLSSIEQNRSELQRNFLSLYQVACRALAQRDAEIRRLNTRVNDLVQLASVTVTTARRLSATDSLQQNVDLSDRNTQTVRPTQLNTSPFLDGLSLTDVRDSGCLTSPRDHSAQDSFSSVASVKLPTIMINTHTTPTTTSAANRVSCEQESVVTSCSVSEPQIKILSSGPAIHMYDGFAVCVSDAKSGGNVSSVSSVSVAKSATPQQLSVGNVGPTLLSAAEDDSLAKTAMSSSAIDLRSTSSAVPGSGGDVVISTVSSMSHVNAAAHLTNSVVRPPQNSSPRKSALPSSAVPTSSLTTCSSDVVVNPVLIVEQMHALAHSTPSTSSTERLKNASLTKAISSPSAVELCVTSLSVTTCGTDVVINPVPSVSQSTLPTSSAVTKTRERLTAASDEQSPANTLSTSFSIVNKRKATTKEPNHCIETNASAPTLSVNSAVDTVCVTSDARTSNSTSNVDSLTSLVTQTKSSKSSESDDKGKAASVSRKRSRKSNDDKATAEVSDGVETGEKPTKCAKLEEAVVVSSTAGTQPSSAESKDILSAVKVTGLTDIQRVSCYKTIGYREELARVIGLKSAEQSHRRKSLLAKAAKSLNNSDTGLGDHTVDKSEDGRDSIGSLSVPVARKSARRVPFVTVSDNLPATPTLFTLRSRARLAQLKNGSQNISQADMEPQSALTQTGITMNSADTSVEGERIQATASSAGVHSAQQGADHSFFTASNVSETAPAPGTNEPMAGSLQNNKPDDDRLQLSQKLNSDIISHNATLSTNEKSKLSMSGKTSTPVSTTLVDKTASSAHKTQDLTKAKPDANRNVVDSVRRTPKKSPQSSIGTRSSVRNSNTETVNASKSVQASQHNSVSYSEPQSAKTGHVKVLDTKSNHGQKVAANKSTVKSETIKPQEEAVGGNSMKIDHNKVKVSQKQTVQQKETVPCTEAENTPGKVTKDVENAKRQNSEGGNDRSDSLQGTAVECGKKAKLQDLRCSQESQAVAVSKPLDTAITSTSSVKSSSFNKDLSGEVDPSKTLQRKSIGTDLHQTALAPSTSAVAETQKLIRGQPTTPIKQVSDLDLAKAVLSLTSLSRGYKDPVDLMDVAIAGTPAQYPHADDSSDSLLLSPFGVDETAHDDAAPNNGDFVVPDNPAAELADASVCGDACSTCCDTCCSTCCSTSVSDNIDKQRHDATSQHTPAAASTPSSPFKVFRNSDRCVSDTDDSLEDSSNTVSRTPPYAGVDVEPVEMEDTDGDAEVANTAADEVALPDTEVDFKGRQKNSVGAADADEPLVLIAGTTNTLDTLFGEVSDTDSEPSHSEQAANNSVPDKNSIAILSVNNEQPPAATVEAVDVEDGEITDSDSEAGVASTSAVPSNKENTAVSVTIAKGGQAATKQGGGNQQKTGTKLLDRSISVPDSKSTSHTPGRRRTSLDQEWNTSMGNKKRIHSDDRKSSPQFARNGTSDERWGRSSGRKSVDERRDDGTKFRSSGRNSDHRQLSPRKSDTRSHGRGNSNSGRFPFRGCRNASGRSKRY